MEGAVCRCNALKLIDFATPMDIRADAAAYKKLTM
jgi:hypothetical protein